MDVVPARRRLRVTGVVQGVGFRPFVYRLAKQHDLAGWVRNTSTGVEIEVEGSAAMLDSFAAALRAEAPALARLDAITEVEAECVGAAGFEIVESHTSARTDALIPADVATCCDCFAETADPEARRFGYPFTNCTNCGPRFTIIRGVPYGRDQTTMAAFEMCDECEAEYRDPADRRFHAEPIACPNCGPTVWVETSGAAPSPQPSPCKGEGVPVPSPQPSPPGEGVPVPLPRPSPCKGKCEADALRRVGELLRGSRIVAIKGLGGFHLACDARNAPAVQMLRERKGRAAKPFALMVKDLPEARRLCEISEFEESILLSYERPIVLLKRRADADVSDCVAPGNAYLGLMLPYTPLHALIFEQSPPALVMTSGNLAEEPLCHTNDSARRKLGRLADHFLMHNREIQAPCDDSVVRPAGPTEIIRIRRARGFVPNAIELPIECPEILACGAEQKNTFCIAWDRRAVLSQHIGDLDTAETFDYYRYAIEHLKSLFNRAPGIIAHDLHPDYLSTRYALEQQGARLIGVQHHHAHIASCLAENRRTERCIGVALDGTGYGTDSTVWGGEVLVADLAQFERVGHLSLVRLPGGEAAVRDPRRIAAAYIYVAYGNAFERAAKKLELDLTGVERQVLRRQIETGLNSPWTSSAGRLFDAVSAAIGVCRERTYEGQPAIELEMAADECETGEYEVSVRSEDSIVMDGVSVFRSAVEDRVSGTPANVVSARFHNTMVRLAARACELVRERTGLNLVALSGGVFQNALMLVRLRKLLERGGFEVITHSQVPPNDGGISLGQAAVAAATLGGGIRGCA